MGQVSGTKASVTFIRQALKGGEEIAASGFLRVGDCVEVVGQDQLFGDTFGRCDFED